MSKKGDKDDKGGGTGVEILGQAAETAKADGKGGRVAGPTLGDDAPLYGKEPDLPCEFRFAKGCVVVEFGKATDEAEFNRAQATFFVQILLAHARQLKANRRGASDADGDDIEAVRDVKLKGGKVIVKFPASKKKHEFSKPEAKYLAGRMAPEIVRLPLLKG